MYWLLNGSAVHMITKDCCWCCLIILTVFPWMLLLLFELMSVHHLCVLCRSGTTILRLKPKFLPRDASGITPIRDRICTQLTVHCPSAYTVQSRPGTTRNHTTWITSIQGYARHPDNSVFTIRRWGSHCPQENAWLMWLVTCHWHRDRVTVRRMCSRPRYHTWKLRSVSYNELATNFSTFLILM